MQKKKNEPRHDNFFGCWMFCGSSLCEMRQKSLQSDRYVDMDNWSDLLLITGRCFIGCHCKDTFDMTHVLFSSEDYCSELTQMFMFLVS